MTSRRKTRTKRDCEEAKAEQRAWAAFKPQLGEVRTREDALVLYEQRPPEGSPGRRYYSNLGFFLYTGTIPIEANVAERAVYMPMP
jgi:hypothetical protein